ncbi:coiled-coil domain-containing protein [Apibacter adventoris]|uniref:hypothetical protein n=1 Tax=Apibacter adventoris TaxID=1679466 RepID=UPI000CF70E7E|nr:hypothetical protein [Apibacter adventoris]PQL94519.1 hypothetical protein C4S76_05115 [Apibacter adventoris]
MKKLIFSLITILSFTLGKAQFDTYGNLILPGTNSWILHTPDDGRTTLAIAPKTNNEWDWSKSFDFNNDGTLNIHNRFYAPYIYAPNISFPHNTDPNSIYGINSLGFDDYFIYNNRKLFSYGLGFYNNEAKTLNKFYLSSYHGINFFTEHNLRLSINQNGNIGISTENPDERLTVNGNIHAREVKVDLQVPADYVFQQYYTGTSSLNEEYHFPSLQETEQFIKENHHLPQVPSAQQIQEQGLKVGEMTNLLLQKIEELTLYSIEQDKALQIQEKQLNAYNEKNKALEAQLEIQKSELDQLKQNIKNLLSTSTQP